MEKLPHFHQEIHLQYGSIFQPAMLRKLECSTVDGSEIRRSPVEEKGRLSHYLRRTLYIPGGWPWDF